MKIQFPTAFTILFLVIIFSAIMTWILPAGKFDTIEYNSNKDLFEIKSYTGSITELEANNKTLNNLGVRAKLEKFKNGDISKPIGIPGTYQKLEPNPQGILDIFQAPILGILDSVEVVLFVLIIGGFIGIVNSTGAFDVGIKKLSQILKGNEKWMIISLLTLIAAGGSTFGMAEETIAFYPIIVPVFLAAGYDSLSAVATIYIGSSLGTMASTTNPFSTIIASNAAGINWISGIYGRLIVLIIGLILSAAYIIYYSEKVKTNPKKSLVFDNLEATKNKFSIKNETIDFNLSKKVTLIIFVATFVVMIFGVAKLDWWFLEMTTLFLASSIIIAFIEQIREKKFIENFLLGAKDLLSVALIIGIARGVTVILDNGLISNTLLQLSSEAIAGMEKIVFINSMMVIFSALSFFIPSSSGLAVVSMPIMAPLADIVGISREMIVSSFQYGMGLMAFVTPTGLVLASLTIVDISYKKWIKFITPLLIILIVLASIILTIETYFL